MESDRWLGVELRHFAALQAIAQHGSFRGAATSLGYTQSAVSQQIAMLERLVGERLVDRARGQRPVSLTDAGALVLRHAEAMISRMQAAETELLALSGRVPTLLRIGVYQSVGARLLPYMIQRFIAAGYEGRFQLFTGVTDSSLLERLERDEVDLTFTVFPLPAGPLEGLPLLRDRFVLLTQASSPLAADKRRLTLEDIGKLPIVGYPECRGVSQAESQLRASGIEPNVVLRADDNESVVGLVAAGIGVALAPRLAVPANPDGVVIRELGPLIKPRVLGLVWHRDRYQGPVVQAFLEAAHDACAAFDAAHLVVLSTASA